MVIFLVIAVICIIGLFIYMYQIADPKPIEASGRGNLLKFLNTFFNGGTMVARAPVVYYQIPGQGSKKVQLQHTKTLIGSSDCDIVLDHPSISARHAEIYLAIKRKKRVFVLKNLSKTNPVVWMKKDSSSGEVVRKDITRHMILNPNDENWFLLGNVKMMITVPLIEAEEAVEKPDSKSAEEKVKVDVQEEDVVQEESTNLKPPRHRRRNRGTSPIL